MTIENTYIVDRNLKTVVGQLEEIKELLSEDSGGGSSSGGSMIINLTYDGESDTYTFDKTAEECFEAYSSGIICIVCSTDGPQTVYEIITLVENMDTIYNFTTSNFGNFYATSDNAYPSTEIPGN